MHIQMTDDTLMEISLSLESKEATKDTKDWKVEGGSSNILSFADWASKKGQSTNADPETIQRNVEKMVDVRTLNGMFLVCIKIFCITLYKSNI